MIEEHNQSYFEVSSAVRARGNYDIFAGNEVNGFNACIELCDRHVNPDRPALRWLARDEHEEVLTFGMLRDRASRFAGLLYSLGVRPGDCIAGLLPRSPDLLTVLLGTLRVGAVYQPLFTAFGPKAIETRLAVSMPKLVVTDSVNRPKLNGLDIPIVVTSGDGEEESLRKMLLKYSDDVPPVLLPAQAPFLMLFTSGSTGPPKGLMVPIHALRAIWNYMVYALDIREDDKYWNLADPGWAYGLYYGIIGPLFLGRPTTLVEAFFTVAQSYDAIRRFGITNLAGAPTAYRQMAASSLTPPLGVRVISSAGETLDRNTASWLLGHFRCPARDHFGQTEIGMVLCDHHGLEHPHPVGAIGYPLPGFQVVTLRTDGSQCDDGEPGLLAVDRRSPLFWFEGYCQRGQQSFIAEYYLTGDTAARDADGAFRFVGREDDVITSSGYRIGPSEVESALMEHPSVAEAAVIGRPDVLRTEVVKAFIILTAGSAGTPILAEEIRQFVKRRLAAHAYPRELEFVDFLPKTPSGKLQRFILRQQTLAKVTASHDDDKQV